jgi:iron(III) transport system permease protein
VAVTAPGDRTTAAPSQPVRARSRRAPVGILGSSSAVALLLVAPLVFLLVEAAGAGVHNVAHLIWRQLTASLLWNTIRLMVVVTLLSAVVGTLTAWCVERTDLPGRRIWAVLVVVPFAIPDFVVSFGWASLWSWVQGFKGAVIVMTLAVYPLVYLPVSAALRSADPNLEDVARSLGVGRIRTFVRVTLGQAKGAIFGGCVLVALVILAEYGAFEILAYQTFTTEIFTEFNVFQVPTACALSLVLVLMSIVVLSGEMAARGRGRVVRTASFAQRVVAPKRLGAAKVPVLLGFIALVGLALGVPVGASIYWILEGGSSSVTGITGASILDAGWHTAAYSATAAALATLMALPVAILSVRHTSRISQLLERSTYLVLAMPGVVIAFALGYFSERYANGFAYQSAPMLVVAYAILFFPLALVAVRASVAYFPATFEEVARSLGRKRLEVFRRVTIPLVGPGLAAAFSLVFLAAVTELTATLILRPTGTETLATQFWSYEQNLSYGQAAPFALVMILVAALPSYVVGRYFDRLPTRASAQT